MTNRWTPDFSTEELEQLELREQQIDRRLESLDGQIAELEYAAARLREESEGNNARAFALVAEIKADDVATSTEETR